MMLSLVNEELKAQQYESMIFVDHHALGHLSKELAQRIISYRVAGIISFLEPTTKASEIIKQNKTPLVLIGRNGEYTQTNSVFSDDFKGGCLAAQKLIDLNCKSFVYVTKHAELTVNTMRLNGFKNQLNKNNYTLDKEHIINGNLEIIAEEKLLELLKKDKKIDGIFCFSDFIAFEITHSLQQAGYKIPEDINLIGYDNLQEFLPYPIKISSIDGGKTNSIKEALNIIVNQIKNGYNPSPIYKQIDVFFQEGGTTKQK